MSIVNYKPKSGWCPVDKASGSDVKPKKKTKNRVSKDIIKNYIKKHRRPTSK